MYIETDAGHILFDTGKTGSFIQNAEKLGVDLKNVDLAVLSHGHGDHGGGLLPFLQINDRAKIYAKKSADKDFYFRIMSFYKSVRTDKKVFKNYPFRFNFLDGFTEIMDNVYIITDIKRKYKAPQGNKYLYMKKGSRIVRDDFSHELTMVIKQESSMVVFTGCSHNGTANIIDTVKSRFPGLKIKAVVGGFHLTKLPLVTFLKPSEEEIDILAQKILDENVEMIYTGHCTGKNAFERLKGKLDGNAYYISTGMEFNI